MSPLASRRVVSAFALLVPLLLFECDRATRSTDPLAPDAPSIPDSLRRIVLTLHVDMSSHEITYLANSAGAATSSDAPSFSIIGSDGVQLLTSNMNTTLDRKTSLVRFDVAIQNALSSVDLVTPSFPAPPSGATGVLLFPIQETVTGGNGSIRPSADWTGSPFDFFNDDACKKSNDDCAPYATFPNIAAGATSPSQTVGFVVDNGVTDFEVTMLVSAKLVDRPTGSIGGTVTSPQRGPLADVTVALDGSGTTATSDANGHYAFNGVVPGSHTVDLTSLASPCTDPGAQTANVTGAATAVVDFSVQCPDPPGTVNGTVRTTDPTPLAGIHVSITPGNFTTTTDALGNYSFSDVPVGTYALTLADPPAACYQQNPAALTVKPTASATINFTLSCPAPVITIDAASEVAFNSTATLDASQSRSPAGAPLTVHWDAVAGAVESLDGAMSTYTTSDMPGYVTWRVTLSDGLHTLTSTVQQFVMQRPGHGVFVSTGGADDNPGTRDAPLATIAAALAKAQAAGADVYVVAGNYSQSAPLVLSDGASIYGGLSPAWLFTGNRAVIIGATPALTSASGGASNVTLEWLNVSSSATVHGSSAVGLFLQNSTGVVLKNDDFAAGVGAPGAPGAAGLAGAVASNGGPGASRSDGGAGGFGGAAALGGFPPADAAGLGGGDGICSGTLTTRGTIGANGARGAAGSRAAAAGPPVYSATGYQPSTGLAGGDGAYGTGGTGGTGGIGLSLFSGSCGPAGPGGGGGGGGGAGHGGHGAGSGGGGGASIGVYLSNSSVTASIVSISALSGGIGGGAGVPGAGGAGGTGGLGGSQGDAAQGGNGGHGGPGGNGGAGCGGNGGDIVGVVLFGSSTYTDQGTQFELGSAGSPGGTLCGETSGMKSETYHPTA